jgi:membrane protease YdiL (CAAX protease family)
MPTQVSVPIPRTDVRDRLQESTPYLIATAVFIWILTSVDSIAPPLGIPAALLGLWFVLWLSRERWRDLGLRRPAHWGKAIAYGIGTALFVQVSAFLILMPLAVWFGVPLPDYSRFEAIRGNIPMLVGFLLVSWTTAGFGEEILMRGFMMGRLARLFGSGRAGWIASLVAVSALFGLMHVYQGPIGVLMTGYAGLVMGTLYLACGRNLWPAIIAHGTTDTLSFVLLYTGLVPLPG